MLCRVDISERELTARRSIAISILGVGIERYSKGQRQSIRRSRAPRFLCRSASLSIVEASCSIAELAQLVEHWFCTPEAGGSSPPLSTSLKRVTCGIGLKVCLHLSIQAI